MTMPQKRNPVEVLIGRRSKPESRKGETVPASQNEQSENAITKCSQTILFPVTTSKFDAEFAHLSSIRPFWRFFTSLGPPLLRAVPSAATSSFRTRSLTRQDTATNGTASEWPLKAACEEGKVKAASRSVGGQWTTVWWSSTGQSDRQTTATV